MTTDTQSTHIEVKGSFLFWQRIIFWSSSIFLGALIAYLSRNNGPQQNALPFIIFIALCVVAHYLAIYLTKSQTTISLENGLLIIKQTENKLKKEGAVIIDIGNIRGFEIAKLKHSESLIIYQHDNKYYRYRIYKIDDSLKIKTFLANEIKELTVNNNLNFKNYGAAFLFALKQVFLFTCIIGLLFYSTIFITNNDQFLFKDYKIIYIVGFLTITIVCWLLVISLPAQKKQIRYHGFAFFGNFFFLLLSIAVMIPMYLKIKEFKQEPLSILKVNEILNHPKNKLFYIKNTHYTPQRTLFYQPFVTQPSRSMKLKVEHTFVIPITSPTEHQSIQVINFWLVKEYVQSIRKALDSVSKEKLLRDFAIQSHDKLINEFRKKPTFYKVLYNDLSSNRSHMQAYELIQSSKIANSLTVILEPHWESITTYKQNIRFEILGFAIIIILFNIIAAVIIAINR